MLRLTRKEREILSEVFFLSSSASKGVDAAWFRAQRESALDIMDRLETDGFLRREDGRYVVALVALPRIKHPLAKDAIQTFERIFLVLKDHYRKWQSAPLRADELAKMLDLDETRVRTCLNYMIQGSWWAGRTTDLLGAKDATITPGEAVLRIRKFRDVIEQLQEWQEQNFESRQNAAAISMSRRNWNGSDVDLQDSHLMEGVTEEDVELLRKLLLEIRAGKTLFRPATRAVSDVRDFQVIAKTLVDAHRQGLLHELLPHKETGTGNRWYDHISVRGGLSQKGRQFLQNLNRRELSTPEEILQLKPGLYGINIDLKAAWRWCKNFWSSRNSNRN